MTVQDRYVRRNVLVLSIDNVLFLAGFAFWDPLVIVPAFVQELTGSGVLVGVLNALRILSLTWPQFWVASLLAGSTRSKPLFLQSTFLGRLPVILLALVTLLLFGSRPGLVLAMLIVAVAAFYASEGFASVAGPALLAKVIPTRIRGRFLGGAQLLSSLASLGAGALVRVVLGQTAIPAASRWALLFGCAFLGFAISWVAIACCHEEPDARPPVRLDLRANLRNMGRNLSADGRLRRVIGIRLLLGMAGSVAPFFVVRARDLIPGGDARLGTYLIAQSLGGMLAALLCGHLIDRVGAWAAVRTIAVVQALALAAAALAGLLPLAPTLYLLAFFGVGFVQGSSWWTFMSCLLELAAPDQRPAYLAASILLNSPMFLSALLAGALYGVILPELLFAAALALCGLALVLAWGLARTRYARQEQPDAPATS